MGTLIKPGYDVKPCQISPETRQMVLQQLKNLANQLEDCETAFCSACQREAKPFPSQKAAPQYHVQQCVQVNASARQQEPPPPTVTYPEFNRPPKYMAQTTEKTPPWMRPRYPSLELMSGDLIQGCGCTRRNGLQDQCERQDCRGQPQCLTKPNPSCPPSGGGGVGGKEQQKRQIDDVLCFGCRQEQTMAGAKAAIQKPCGHCVENVQTVAGLTSDMMGGHVAFLVTPLKPVTIKTPDSKPLV